jgi:hypothetical protein
MERSVNIKNDIDDDYIILNAHDLKKVKIEKSYIEEFVSKLPVKIPIEYKVILLNILDKTYTNTKIISSELYLIMKDIFENREEIWSMLQSFLKPTNEQNGYNC